jgi:hypothetical protein
MRLKTILLTTVATGSFLCEPVAAMRVEPPAISEMGWFSKKKKKSNPQDSVKVENEYEKLTGSDSVAHRGMFNVFRKKNDYYFEIPATLLGRDMLVVNKLQRVPSELNEAGVNRGTNYENQMIRLDGSRKLKFRLLWMNRDIFACQAKRFTLQLLYMVGHRQQG